MPFEIFEHTADLGLAIRANSQSGLFEDAAAGLFSLFVANLEDVQPLQERELVVPLPAADDDEQVAIWLFDWLTELLYVFESEHMLFREFRVFFASDRLTACCRGEPMDLARHQMEHEVKAITYHELHAEETSAGWQAQVIVDI